MTWATVPHTCSRINCVLYSSEMRTVSFDISWGPRLIGYLVWSQEGTANGNCGHQLIPQASGSVPAIGYLTSQALTRSLEITGSYWKASSGLLWIWQWWTELKNELLGSRRFATFALEPACPDRPGTLRTYEVSFPISLSHSQVCQRSLILALGWPSLNCLQGLFFNPEGILPLKGDSFLPNLHTEINPLSL